MLHGWLTDDGVPVIGLPVGGRVWPAVVDTGFNGDLELPTALRDQLVVRPAGTVESELAGGRKVSEPAFEVELPFDGATVRVLATFADVPDILLGTRLLKNHRLTISFPAGTLTLERELADGRG